ncbi:TonB-dependent receptor [Aureispira anguillae]|uniref:Carboxypeptidase-like regulatory domain-containing protein n=1 Tax=Aureispira anguillae TaxID=2864201 RepID=A0A916DT93_9BACT|nr:carboxypeptidase-like regulatory domain-containing protein [Aureispira anguillae]BDS11680.1 carboxypeptidase-like regulatory domain-containing protein [Aureispira anguillae]
MKNILIFLCSFIGICSIVAQETPSQTIRGKVVDKVSQMPLIGVVILVAETDLNTTSDIDGNFVLENVPIGRQIITTQYLGYEPYISEDLIISSSKEMYLEIGLTEQVEVTETVVVTASGSADGVGNQAINDLSVVSARSFSVEETKRYAASIDDPGRMAAALPGIQTDQDNENDVVIRGNSAFGVLWRMEGLEIPNPTHFGRPGTTGGGISVFSASVLGNTDLSTGGFAAEYGNALSGVFDMRNRRGNMVNREHSIKIGLIGLGASTEGPIKKGRSSYLINYRYSTLGILNAIGMYVVRENVGNNFQDLSFNLTFNSKDNKDEFKIFGIGGLSDEIWFTKEDTTEWKTYLDYIDERNGSNLGILGFTYRRLINEKSYLKVVLGTVLNHHYLKQAIPNLTTLDIKDKDVVEDYDYKTLRSQLHLTYSNKLSNRFRLKAGASLSANTYWLRNSVDNGNGDYNYLDNVNGNTFLVQAYAQGSYRPMEKLTFNFGFHALLLTLNNTYSIEPRVSMQYKPFKNTTLSAAYGLHGKALPIGTYLLQLPDASGAITQPNRNLKIAKAHHAILAFQQVIGLGFRLNLEGYYQYTFDNPTSPIPNSGYWFLNERDNYGTQAMVSEGQGQNYGVDLSIEKAFSRNFFILATGSLFWSQYKSLGDEFWRRTRIDKRWGVAVMGGYEFTFKKGGVLQIGLKSFVSGGLRYTPADVEASKKAGVLVEDTNNYWGASSGTYFRLDGRIAYRKDHKKLSYTISLDVQNITNTKNVRYFIYDRTEGTLVPRHQSGLLPVISFQIDF